MQITARLLSLSLLASLAIAASAQTSAPPPVTFTADQDHQNMMDQLGGKALRPGPAGDERAPNHANYDESPANPYPNLPDALILNSGQKVTPAEQCRHQRRPELVDGLEQYVYGRIPKNLPKVEWTETTSEHELIAFHPVIATELNGHVDNSAYPAIDVNLHMTLVLPTDVKSPVPVLIMFGPSGFPAPVQPSASDLARINTAMKALLIQQDPSLKDTIAEHPGWDPVRPVPYQLPQMNADGDPPSEWELIAAGWGFVRLDPQSAQPDNGQSLTRGIIGLVNKGQPRK